MFKTKQAPASLQQAAARGARPSVPTIISADMVVEGNLKTAGDLHVEGHVIGHVEAGRLVLSESGVIIGNIIADTAQICGTLNGSVQGGKITLTPTAKVTGDIHHDVLAIEAGGMLDGLSRRRVTKPAGQPTTIAITTAEAAE